MKFANSKNKILDDESGRHYIFIHNQDGNKVKTEAGVRKVPISKSILNMGFMAMVNSKNNELFPDLNPKAVTGWFSRYRVKQDVRGVDDFGNRKVFHSFRHSFISKAAGSNIYQELIAGVCGHEISRG